MKMAFCLFKYFPFGGLQRDMLAIAKACMNRGHTVEVFCGLWEGDSPENISVNIVNITGFTNQRRNRSFYEGVQERLAKADFDLVFGFNKMPGLDVYYAADSCFATKAYEKKGPLYRMTKRARESLKYENAVFSRESTTQVLLIAEKEKSKFQRYYKTPDQRLHLLPPGIAKNRILPNNYLAVRTQFREEFDIQPDEKLLLALGSGFKTKGLDRSIKALSGLSDKEKANTKLFVVGKDNPASFIKLARKLNVESMITFFSGRDDANRFLMGSDLLIHPAYFENTGTVLLEAMVSGLPVLTTDVCGYAYYVADEGMGVVDASPFDQSSFNKNLRSLLCEPRDIWFDKGRRFAETADIYDLSNHVAELLEGFMLQS